MDLFRMRCFVSVAEMQSISKAARELYISQPAMSAHMNAIEQEFGAQLLVRGRQTRLTPLGETVLHGFREILGAYDALAIDVASSQIEEHGSLTVGFHGPANWLGVADMFASFRQAHPGVQMHATIDTWGNLLGPVRTGELDLAFMEIEEVEGLHDLSYELLYEEPVCAVMPLTHANAGRESVSVRDFAGDIMHFADVATSPRFFHGLHESCRRGGMKVESVGAGNHYESCITLVMAGSGITCMPASLCEGYKGRVACVPFNDLETHMRYVLAWSRERVSALAQEFVAHARATLDARG